MTSWKNNNTLESRRLVEETLNSVEKSGKVVAKDGIHLRKLIEKRIKEFGPNCDLNDIDVSRVTNMRHLFHDLVHQRLELESYLVAYLSRGVCE